MTALRNNVLRFVWTVALCVCAIIASAALISNASRAFHSASPDASSQPRSHVPNNSQARATFTDVVDFVNRYGWPADLGEMCVAFGLDASMSSCRFKQISVDVDDQLEVHAINLPSNKPDFAPYVVLFHLRPLVAEFFVVSPTGELLQTVYRAKGVGYTRIPNPEANAAFESERLYWQSNLAQFERHFQEPRSGAQ